MEAGSIRMDKFLWSVRIFKTRTLATEACDKGRVLINDQTVKPSRNVKTGEIILVKKPPVVHSYRVLKLLHNRLSADKVKEYIEELTPQEEIDKHILARKSAFVVRDPGAGRPTKKERRQLDKLTDFDEDL